MECEFSPISFERRRSRLKTRAQCSSFFFFSDLFVHLSPPLFVRDLALTRILSLCFSPFFHALQTQLVQSTSAARSTRDYNGCCACSRAANEIRKNRAFGLAGLLNDTRLLPRFGQKPPLETTVVALLLFVFARRLRGAVNEADTLHRHSSFFSLPLTDAKPNTPSVGRENRSRH